MLLSVKARQAYLKELGLYSGKIDGKEGTLTKKAYTNLQRKYFTNKKDIDGKYGINTDNLLRSAYNCRDLKHFTLKEFKCGCNNKYCTGYPTILNRDLVLYLDKLRDKYKKPITITSGMRCSTWNSKSGGVSGSRHKVGKAVDIYINGISSTFKGRKEIINYWIKNYNNSRYGYCNGYGRTKSKISYPTSKTMGNATHVDVK